MAQSAGVFELSVFFFSISQASTFFSLRFVVLQFDIKATSGADWSCALVSCVGSLEMCYMNSILIKGMRLKTDICIEIC